MEITSSYFKMASFPPPCPCNICVILQVITRVERITLRTNGVEPSRAGRRGITGAGWISMRTARSFTTTRNTPRIFFTKRAQKIVQDHDPNQVKGKKHSGRY